MNRTENNSFAGVGFGEKNPTGDMRSDQTSSKLFRVSIIILSTIGFFLNILVSTALFRKPLRNQTFIIFTISQTTIDFVACLFSLITYSLKIAFNDDPVWMRQTWSLAICYVFTSNNFLNLCLMFSNGNLILIAIERYVKIVHSTFYRNHFSKFVKINITFDHSVPINLIHFNINFVARHETQMKTIYSCSEFSD